jgi:biotin synthase
LEVESLPVNFLMPIAGTPLAGRWELTPTRCLNTLALYRFLNPKSALRISGGRELHLRSLQALGLYIANSIFIGDYLTTQGQPAEADLQMIQDLGFEIEGDVPSSGPAPVAGGADRRPSPLRERAARFAGLGEGGVGLP